MPALGLSGKVRQCLYQIWFCPDQPKELQYERTNLTMRDGGTISIDWARAEANKMFLWKEPSLGDSMLSAAQKKRRVCMVFPGLSGGSDRGYVKGLVRTLLTDGFEVAVFHNRGVCNTPYTSLEFADLSSTEEVDAALAFVQEKAAGADLVGIGLSMGGNIILRTAGMYGDKFPLKVIIAVNNPFDLNLAINLMRGSAYEKNLAKELKRQLVCAEEMPED